jgi:hypothetical protein
MSEYYYLQKDEVIEEGDEYDAAPNPWHDDTDWQPVKYGTGRGIGGRAPDPQYPAHTLYRRKMDGKS